MTQTLAILKLLGLMNYFAPDDSKKDLDLPYLFYWYGPERDPLTRLAFGNLLLDS